MTSNDESAWEAEISRYLDFLVNSDNEEDLVAILRGHLYIEIALSELLSAKSTGTNESTGDLSYQEKVDKTKSLDLLDKEHRKMLTEIGALRNRFSHLPIKSTVDDCDLASLAKTLPRKIASAAEDKTGDRFYTERDPNAPSTKVRIILRVVFNWLSSRAASEHDLGRNL